MTFNCLALGALGALGVLVLILDFLPQSGQFSGPVPLTINQSLSSLRPPQLFLQRERAAVLAEAQTDDLIKEAPKPALDQSGEWQETGGEIQWVANDNNNESSRQEDDKKKKKDEEDEELDLNKGTAALLSAACDEAVRSNILTCSVPPSRSSAARGEAHGGQHRGLLHCTAAGLPVSGEPGESHLLSHLSGWSWSSHTHTHTPGRGVTMVTELRLCLSTS